MRPTSQYTKDAIVRMYREGRPWAEIIQSTGVSEMTVKRVLAQANIARRNHHFSEDAKKAIVKAYADGVPMASIMARYGVGHTTVREYAKKAGLRARVVHITPTNKLAPEVVEAIVRAYADGRLVKDIMKDLGVSYSSVQKYVRLSGLPIREADDFKKPFPPAPEVVEAVRKELRNGTKKWWICETYHIGIRRLKTIEKSL